MLKLFKQLAWKSYKSLGAMLVVSLLSFSLAQAQSCLQIVNLTASIKGAVIEEQARDFLTSTSTIESSKATFRAGQSVTLTPGFEVVPGSVFEATIAPCKAVEMNAASLQEEILSLIAYPNPFSKDITVEYTLPEAGRTNLYVSDMRGIVVAKLLNETNHNQGIHRVPTNLENLAEGAYVITLDTDQGRKSLVVVKQR